MQRRGKRGAKKVLKRQMRRAREENSQRECKNGKSMLRHVSTHVHRMGRTQLRPHIAVLLKGWLRLHTERMENGEKKTDDHGRHQGLSYFRESVHSLQACGNCAPRLAHWQATAQSLLVHVALHAAGLFERVCASTARQGRRR